MNRWLTFLLLGTISTAYGQALVLDATHFFPENKTYQKSYVYNLNEVNYDTSVVYNGHPLLQQNGANQVWDFSDLDVFAPFTYELTLYNVLESASGASWLDSLPTAERRSRDLEYSDILNFGYIHYLQEDNGVVQRLGYSTISAGFGEGEVKHFDNPQNMFYEGLTFGDVRVDTFVRSTQQWGIDTMVADGYGVIVLPDGDTIADVLRVRHTTHISHSFFPEFSEGSSSTAVYWFAAGYDSPLYIFQPEYSPGLGQIYMQRYNFKPAIDTYLNYCVKDIHGNRIGNFEAGMYHPRFDEIELDAHYIIEGQDCFIIPYKSLSYNRQIGIQKYYRARNGLSTLDLVKIKRHILGTAPFEEPWQYIAADVNNSGTITNADLILIRQVILGILPHFPDQADWRFFPVDYEFPDETNPLAELLPRGFNVPEAVFDGATFQFLGVKMGDVNASADPEE